MSVTLILMLPPAGAEPVALDRGWWRIANHAIQASGRGEDWRDTMSSEDKIVALAPVCDAPVRWQHLPDLTAPQAMTAARLAAAEAVLGDAGLSHVAAGLPNADALVPSCAVARRAMEAWLALLADAGMTVDAVVPVAALLPPAAGGAAIAAIVGGEAMLAADGLTAARDPAIDALRLNARVPSALGDGDAESGLAMLGDGAPINLLAGDYAPRRSSVLPPVFRRWAPRLAAALLLVTLAIPLAQLWQWSRASSSADARVLTAAAGVGIKAVDAAGAEAAIDAQLAARGGGALALSAPLGGLYRALQAQSAVAIRSLSHGANGTVSVTLAAPRIDEVNAVLKDLQARGFTVTAQPMSGSDGMQMAAITLRAVP
jgi:general secretion pathway protein L